MRENELHSLTVEMLAGQTHKPKRVYRILNERIVNVVADYNNRTFVEFLRGIFEHNIQLLISTSTVLGFYHLYYLVFCQLLVTKCCVS